MPKVVDGKQLLVIGNGFDKACGLESSFSDFYKACIWKRYSTYATTEPEYFWQKFLCCVDEAKIDRSDLDDEKVFWERFFDGRSTPNAKETLNTENKPAAKDTSNDEDKYRWCDIERIITYMLNSIGDTGRNQRLIRVAFDNANRQLSYPPRMAKQNELFFCGYFQRHLAEWLAAKNKTAEPYFDVFSKRIESGHVYPSFGAVLDDIYKHLLAELRGLERQFCTYLSKHLKEKPDYQERALKLFNEIYSGSFDVVDDKQLSEKRINAKKERLKGTNVLSFNYTNPFLGSGLYGELKVANVHGSLCDDSCDECNKERIIFGIDATSIKSKDRESLKQFSKAYRKESMRLKNYGITLCDSEYTNIIIFGHSLAPADYSYFQAIFDSFNIYDNSKVSLLFYYHKAEDREAINSLLSVYGNTLSNKTQGQILMTKLQLEGRLRIENLDERRAEWDNLKKSLIEKRQKEKAAAADLCASDSDT